MDRNQIKPQTVAEAKMQLRSTRQQVDYLAPVKDHPVASAGAAFMVGMLLSKGKLKLPPSLLSIGLQLLRKM